ncbi:MAG: TIGR02757 family protein [Bacteroidales bacterium]|jgi:uncharacterized protein (TIGR02757 family)|nr:TIGR02757 family protein [Bacteroidales bacterium]
MNIREQLIEWADKYEDTEFIKNDPIQFPHRFTGKQDVEISALLTAYLAFGRRAQIIKKVDELHAIMGYSPHTYILKGDFSYFRRADKRKFYRFIAYTDIYELLSILCDCYTQFNDLETIVISNKLVPPVEALQKLFGHVHYFPSPNSTSACKRINMFLRWMCRQDSCVDLGIWKSVDPSKLSIPLDTHVHKMSIRLGITKRKNADKVTSMEIDRYFKGIFPDDPSRGDFSLFGYAVNNPEYFD